jgi:hypothetical protein
MANFIQLERIKHILLVVSKDYTSKKKIMEALRDANIVISYRSLERDLKLIKEELGYALVYKKEQGYYLDEPINKPQLVLSSLDKLADYSQEKRQQEHIISSSYRLFFSSANQSKVTNELIGYLNKKQIIKVTYLNNNGDKEILKLVPLFVKEFFNDWQLIAHDVASNKAIAISLLSIEKLKPMQKFEGSLDEAGITYYSNRIGVSKSTSNSEQPIAIEITVNHNLYSQLAFYPLHPSQVYKGNLAKNQYTFAFVLTPNSEFELFCNCNKDSIYYMNRIMF